MSHIIDAVQVSGSLLVEHVLALAAYDFEGIGAVEQLAGLSGKKQQVLLNRRCKVGNCYGSATKEGQALDTRH